MQNQEQVQRVTIEKITGQINRLLNQVGTLVNTLEDGLNSAHQEIMALRASNDQKDALLKEITQKEVIVKEE